MHGRADMMEAEAWNEPSVEPCPSYPEGGKANAYKNRPACTVCLYIPNPAASEIM